MPAPFTIRIDQADLDDLQNRLAFTRWPDQLPGPAWEAGTDLRYLRELCTYWQTSFDWRRAEARLNRFPQFRAEVDGFGLHFLHIRSNAPQRLPLLLIHGWPDSFVRFLKIIPLLTQARGELGFDVIVPSLPGYGFSDRPTEPGMNPAAIARLFARLMTEELGYEQFLVQGGDWGSSITEQLARQFPKQVLGIHLTDVPYQHLFTVPPGDLSRAEKKYLETGKQWQQKEGAYALLQSTKPQTLAYGLHDSPAALAAWIIEKFYRWSDCHGDLESVYTKDELLTNISLYWLTQNTNSANHLYYQTAHYPTPPGGQIATPTAVAIFPQDLIPAPREFAERIFNVQQWTEMPRGGHFAAWEQPELLAEDIRQFARKINL